MILTAKQIEDIFVDAGVAIEDFRGNSWSGIHLLDTHFHTISGIQVRQAFYNSVETLPDELRQDGLPKWQEDSGDCENISFWIMSDIQKMNAATAARKGVKRKGIAVMPIAYEAEARTESGVSGGHCILAYINHRKNLKFFEPQIGRDVTLTPKEIESIWFVLAA